MKKFVLLLLIIIFTAPVFAGEIEDDYLDITSNYCVLGDYESAVEYLDKILSINPANSKVLGLKHRLNLLIDGEKQSFLSSISPKIKDSIDVKGTGNLKGELDILSDVVTGGKSYLGYYYLGNFYRDINDLSRAAEAYKNSISARGDFAQAYLSYSIVLFELGRYNAVLAPIDKYISFEPDDDLAYAIKSRAEFELGQTDKARQDNEKALKINDCPEYKFDKAKIYYKLGDYAKAKKIFKSLEKDIQISKIYEYMGLCDIAMNDYSNALINIDKALLLANNDRYLEEKYEQIKQKLGTK